MTTSRALHGRAAWPWLAATTGAVALAMLAGGDVRSSAFQSAERATLGTRGALDGVRYRVIVTSDIGGTDPDDFQSMVHLLLYADAFDLEGLISSPYGPGRKRHILDVIDRYARDYPNLRTYSERYPAADALRAIAKQGETEVAPYAGVRRPTEGSRWIVDRAKAGDPRPLHVLVWGGLEDLAQALHDAPEILPKLRVYYVGGPNKKWSPDAYEYLVTHHPDLWIIEANSTYRGWFTGGDQTGEWGNAAFVQSSVAGHGALGDFFASQLDGVVKMGDTTSVARLLRGSPDDPAQPSWGGRYVRTWERPRVTFNRVTSKSDTMEQFGILELTLPIDSSAPARPAVSLVIENQELAGFVDGNRVRFRFSAKDAKTYTYELRGNVPSLTGTTGGITAVPHAPDAASRPAARLQNWWTDDPSAAVAETGHPGARTVSQWRRAFLSDFAARLRRAKAPQHAAIVTPRNQ